MGRFTASADDLAKGRLVTPGWHTVEIVSVEDTEDKDNALLTVVLGRVIGGKEDEKGAILRTQFSEKAPAFCKNFVEALSTTDKPVKFEADRPYEINNQNFRGKKMEWYVERDTYKGRAKNNVADYRPLQS